MAGMSMAKRYGEDDLVGFITDETEENAYNKEQELRGLLREKKRRELGQTTSFGTPSTSSGSGSGSGLTLQHQVSLPPGGRIGRPGGGAGAMPGTVQAEAQKAIQIQVQQQQQQQAQPPTIAPPPNIVYPGSTTPDGTTTMTDGGGGVAPPAGGDSGYTDAGMPTGITPVDTSQQAQPGYSDEGAYAGAGEEAPGSEEGPAPSEQPSTAQEQIIVSEDEGPKQKEVVVDTEEKNPIKRFLDKLKNLFK